MKNIKDINIWKEKPMENMNYSALENADITELGLSPRSYNGLKRGGYQTVGDVLALIGENGGEGIKGVRNLGEKSQREIIEKLEILKESYKTLAPVSYQTGTKKVLLMPNGKTWNREIGTLHLSDSSRNQLRQSGIIRVGDIYSPTLRKDPGWIAVRELFDRIINEAS